MGSPILWGPNNTSNSLQNGLVLGDGQWIRNEGTKNYIRNGKFYNGQTTGWSLFTTTMTGINPTGIVNNGAAAITSFGVTNSNPLTGTGSLNIASTGAISAGQGFISDAFTIEDEDLARILAFSMSTRILSGANNLTLSGTTTNSFAVYLYDITNLAWVQPSGCFSLSTATGIGRPSGTFQTSITSGQKYALAVLCINPTLGAVSINFSSFSVGPQVTSIGYAGSDPQTFPLTVMTGATVVTPPTFSGNNVKYWRVGNRLMMRVDQTWSTASSAPGSGTYTFSLPPGLSADGSAINIGNGVVGTFKANDNSNAGIGNVLLVSSTTVSLYGKYSGAGATGTINDFWVGTSGFGYNDAPAILSFWAEIPIAGWSSNTLVSSDSSQVVNAVTLNATGTPSLAANAYTKFTGLSVVNQLGSIWDNTNQYIKAAVSGFYDIGITFSTNGTASAIPAYSINQTGNWIKGGTFTTTNSFSSTWLVWLNAGDRLEFGAYSNTAISNYANYTFCYAALRQGPAQIPASESNVTCYSSTAGQALTANTETIIYFANREIDDRGSYNSTTGTYTASESGKYRITVQLGFNPAAGAIFYAGFRDNGTQIGFGCELGQGQTITVPCSKVVRLTAGQTVTIRGNSTLNVNLMTATGYTYFIIEKVGSY